MNPSQGKLLIVDDETSIRRAMLATLRPMGFDAAEASTGEAALEMVRAAHYDVVLLDINMPGMGGISACREMRRLLPRLGILMVTVRDGEDDKIAALDAGADDYVTKPFHVRELAARVRSAVRRSQTPAVDAAAVIRIGDIVLDPARRLVEKAGETVRLTPKEFDLLCYLMSHAGLPITHARLLHAVWGPEYGGELEYLRTFMRQLRKKLEEDPSSPRYLLTDSHVGYRFRDAAPEPAGAGARQPGRINVTS
jgi:two-component system KDP operon response regulator KdpE